MKINNIIKLFLLSIFLSANISANEMIDQEMMPTPSKKNIKAKLPLDYNKDEYLGEDIKYDVQTQRVKEFKLFDVDGDFGYINVAKQKVGQSGIVVDKSSSSPIIIAIASVVQSDDTKTKLEFKEFDGFKQDAIPNSKLKASDGDFFILNYLYEASIIIAPNNESFQTLRKKLPSFDFLHSDMLASFLKVEEEPIPSKDLIQRFALEQNLGSIFVIIENKAYQIDTRTFKIVNILDISYGDKKTMKPFYTRVDEIEQGTFDFGAEEIDEYTQYYKELLDIK